MAGRVPVEVDPGGGRAERAHRQHAGRGDRAAPQPERQCQARALGEPGEDCLAALETLLGALRVDEGIEGIERGVEAGLVETFRAEIEPREPGRAGRGDRSARQDGGKPTFGIEVGQESAEIALVGAVAVHQEQEPLGARGGDDVGDEFHGRQPTAECPGPTPVSSGDRSIGLTARRGAT